MTKANGPVRIDAVEVGEVTVNLLGPEPILSAKFAYSNSESGIRFGSGNKNVGWSETTLALLIELQMAMEADIVSDVFDQGTTPTTAGIPSVDEATSDGVPGL